MWRRGWALLISCARATRTQELLFHTLRAMLLACAQFEINQGPSRKKNQTHLLAILSTVLPFGAALTGRATRRKSQLAQPFSIGEGFRSSLVR